MSWRALHVTEAVAPAGGMIPLRDVVQECVAWIKRNWVRTLVFSLISFVIGWVWNTYLMAKGLEGSLPDPGSTTVATAEGKSANGIYWLLVATIGFGLVTYARERGLKAFFDDLGELPRTLARSWRANPKGAAAMFLWGAALSLTISALLSRAIAGVLGVGLLLTAASPLAVILNNIVTRVWVGVFSTAAPRYRDELPSMANPFMMMTGEAAGMLLAYFIASGATKIVLALLCVGGGYLVVVSKNKPAPSATTLVLLVMAFVAAWDVLNAAGAIADDGGWLECVTDDGTPCSERGFRGIFDWMRSDGADKVLAQGRIGGYFSAIGCAVGCALGGGLGHLSSAFRGGPPGGATAAGTSVGTAPAGSAPGAPPAPGQVVQAPAGSDALAAQSPSAPPESATAGSLADAGGPPSPVAPDAPAAPPVDAGAPAPTAPGVDAGASAPGVDAGAPAPTAPGVDAGATAPTAPGVDAGTAPTAPGVDAGAPAPGAPPVDAGTAPTAPTAPAAPAAPGVDAGAPPTAPPVDTGAPSPAAPAPPAAPGVDTGGAPAPAPPGAPDVAASADVAAAQQGAPAAAGPDTGLPQKGDVAASGAGKVVEGRADADLKMGVRRTDAGAAGAPAGPDTGLPQKGDVAASGTGKVVRGGRADPDLKMGARRTDTAGLPTKGRSAADLPTKGRSASDIPTKGDGPGAGASKNVEGGRPDIDSKMGVREGRGEGRGRGAGDLPTKRRSLDDVTQQKDTPGLQDDVLPDEDKFRERRARRRKGRDAPDGGDDRVV